jgi:hypothetical protein
MSANCGNCGPATAGLVLRKTAPTNDPPWRDFGPYRDTRLGGHIASDYLGDPNEDTMTTPAMSERPDHCRRESMADPGLMCPSGPDVSEP